MKFYVIEENAFDDKNYAYGEKVFPVYGDPRFCDACGSPVSMLQWLPPLQAKLSKPSYGDFVFGSFQTFLVSQRVQEAYEASCLKGITSFEAVEIVKVSRKRASSAPPPRYFYVTIEKTKARVDDAASHFVRTGEAQCEVCMAGTILADMDGVILTEQSWTGEDIFYAENLHGTILVSQRFYDFVKTNEFTNLNLVPAEKYVASYIHK